MRVAHIGFIALLASFAGSASAKLDIVSTNADAQSPTYLLKDTTTGKVFGTFWDAANDSSDYGFESDNPPEFLWSADRAYLAVNPSDNQARWTTPFLYRVTADSLEPIELPALPPGSADALEAVRNGASQLAADQTTAVRWQNNGSLLMSYFAATRETDEKPQIEASLWADVTFDGDTASIAATGPTEPAVDSSVAATIAASLQPAAISDKPLLESEPYWSGSPDDLVGIHPVSGKNPDGSAYEGTVEIKVQPEGMAGGMRVTMEWKVGANVTSGSGLLQERNLAIALEDGVALYKVVGEWSKFVNPDDGGLTLAGLWTTAGSGVATPETITVGKPTDPVPSFPNVTLINGRFMTMEKAVVTITGDGEAKAITWTKDGKSEELTGLALGNGLAVRRAQGVSVFFVNTALDAPYLMGQTLTAENTIESENLFPPF